MLLTTKLRLEKLEKEKERIQNEIDSILKSENEEIEFEHKKYQSNRDYGHGNSWNENGNGSWESGGD